VPESDQTGRVTRFGAFEIDLQAGELRKSGLRVKLQDQPFQILALLLERPGQVVTREELRQRLWPADTFVDYDHNLNSSIKKLRQALGDDSDNPRFVETLPRRGYRLIVPVAASIPLAGELAEEVPPARPEARDRTSLYWFVAIGAVIVTAGALAVWKTGIQTPSSPKVIRFTALTSDGQEKHGPILTDGSRLYFNEVLPGPRRLIVQVPVKSGEGVPLSVSLKQPELLDLSRDGNDLLIANHIDNGPSSLWVQSVTGGSPRRIGTILAVDARFGPDERSIIYSNLSEVYSVNRDGTSLRKLLTIDRFPIAFRFSPDARGFRFTHHDDRNDIDTIMEADADGAGLHKLFEGSFGKWTSDGRFFIFEAEREGKLDLWALEEAKGFPWWKPGKKSSQLTAGPLNFKHPLPSIDGRQIFAIGESRRAEVIRFDSRKGRFMPYLSGISAEGLSFSRDGQCVTYTSFPDGTLWRSKVDGSERLQLTFPPLKALLPRWAPDAKQIAFNATLPGGNWNVYLVSSEGGTPQRILPSEQSQMDASWSPDGNSMVFGTFSTVLKAPIYTIDLRSKRVSPLPGSMGLFSPRWSPDGRYIAAITFADLKLVLFDFATQKWTEAFGSEIGYLSWSHDGKYIYFQDVPQF
jgi:DNA-binding winged helix-turn-helix (wHTH) protein/Tol biopolymer transport system component